MSFEFIKLEIPELVHIKPKLFNDERGFFLESYKKSQFVKNGIIDNFSQDNHSKSIKGVLRGLHYQLNPKGQSKLVRCISGNIFDVAVDIRKNSPTFGKWCGVNLNSENQHMLYVPNGFAHGFIVLSEEAEVIYKTSNEYSPEDERGIIWNDPTININWIIDEPIVSVKDSIQPTLINAEINFVYGE